MLRKIRFYIAPLFVFLLTISVISKPAVALEDAILAIVNDELVTLKDLRDYVRSTYVSLVAEGREQSEIEKVMLDLEINGLKKLIEDKLILSKANEMGLAVKDKLVDSRIEKIKERYSSEQKFTEALVKNGATITDVRKKVTDQLKITYVIEEEIKRKIFVNPQEVTDFYNENIQMFQQKEKVDVDSIYIPYGDDKEKAIKTANVALEFIQNGSDFKEMANTYSKSSSLGMVERGSLLAEIEKVIFHLEEGEHSDLIEISTGIYIFKVNQKIESQLAPIADVKELITGTIYNNKFRERFLAWLENLKNRVEN